VTDYGQNTQFDNGNTKLGVAHPAPPVTGFDHRVSATSPQIENGSPKIEPAQIGPRLPNLDLRVSAKPPHLTPQRLQFLLRVTPPALESQRQYEVPACVTIAQAILESATPQFGWGSSSLFRLANNPFGIKYEHFESGDRVIGRSGEQIVISDS